MPAFGLAIIHILYCIPVFAFLHVNAPLDALVVIVRFAASSIVCRLIVMFELAGLRKPDNVTGGRNSSEAHGLLL